MAETKGDKGAKADKGAKSGKTDKPAAKGGGKARVCGREGRQGQAAGA